jgi:hypothetical protein
VLGRFDRVRGGAALRVLANRGGANGRGFEVEVRTRMKRINANMKRIELEM